MKSMKKVELVIEAIYINRVLELFEKHKISGYTLIKDIEGAGGHGLKMADDVTDVFSNDLIFTVCDEEKWVEMKEEIRIFEDKYGGKCFVSDTMMLI